MPITTQFPGVYLERLPSGLHAIGGVSTSVGAFIGEASRGAVNAAVRILNYSDFERNFGGLVSRYDLGFAVRQFFANGGAEAWVVRVAANPNFAKLDLRASDNTLVATLTALDAGDFGNTIKAVIDWNTSSPANSFNLTLTPSDDPGSAESYTALSMNSQDPKYLEAALAGSRLVSAKRAAGLAFPDAGTSTSADIGDVLAALTPPPGQPQRSDFRVIVNGLPVIRVSIGAGDFLGGDNPTRLGNLAIAIRTKVRAANAAPAVQNFTCAVAGAKLLLTSGAAGENSSVRVLAGAANDAAAFLTLGLANGGVEVDGASKLRPRPIPDPGSLTGATLPADALDAAPAAGAQKLQIALDGGVADTIDVGAAAASGGAGALAANLADVAARLQTALRGMRNTPAYKNFSATVSGGDKLVLASGSPGAGSTVQVAAAGADTLATTLGLLAGAVAVPGVDASLQGGSVADITPATTYASYVPAGPGRQGIRALDEVDLFNLMVMPGVTDPATLSDAAAYCESRRAFLIVDSPFDVSVDKMEKKVKGPELPKSVNAAVFYPYIKVADPLNPGQLRTMPPSGAIAGVFARTDATRGVWKAPAGTDATIVGALGVQYTLTNDQNGIVNPWGVNCIRVLPPFGVVSWGARTLRGSDEESNDYKYIPVSRTALFLEESLYRGLQWVVFEPNDEPLWSQIRLNIGAFLQGLFRQGAFAGASAREAYFVKCDAETTTPTDQLRGRVNIIVGFAPLRPAEFVVIQLQQIAGQAANG
ncbi:phage tail sheath C-terminal domain-containing protein [uncultured Rhodoblastus sp.]|uniref:phage tail sheath family protein n=1 Tax=uncultured Rhodoblastus sp. TaxID=543037 RepID=UPI0025DDE404|nr:phage tail sheath C-terminal domain-containing protein [uncultured Rhodoblastus sp.]